VIDYALEQVIDIYENKGVFIPFSISDWGVLQRYITEEEDGFSVTQENISTWIKLLSENSWNDKINIFIHDWLLTLPDEDFKRDALIIQSFDYTIWKVFTFWLIYEVVKKFLRKPIINEIGNMKTLDIKDIK
jgi:hypothetical protein